MKHVFRAVLARAFERQVRRFIRRHHLQVVAVAGSVGKTGTRMAVATVLREKYRTQAVNQLGYNSELGLPLSVFELDTPSSLANPLGWAVRLVRTEQKILGPRPFDVLVLELGTDHPGEIARYLRYLTPDLGIMTAVSPEHMENFPGGLAQVAAEELLLAGASKRFLASHDDIPAYYRHKYVDHHPDHAYYGTSKDATYWVTTPEPTSPEGIECNFNKHPRGTLKSVSISLWGEQGAKTAVAAYAAADLMGLSATEIKSGLQKLSAIPGRLNVLPGINGSLLIDDTYNASPSAMRASLDMLAHFPTAGRRLALLGSMNELGPEASRYHAEAGAWAAGVDLLVTLGDLSNRYLGPAAVRAGLDPTRVQAASSPYAAGDYLKLILKPGDVLLAKGSQNGVFAEEALKSLLNDPSDQSKLVRQSPKWLRQKTSQFK